MTQDQGGPARNGGSRSQDECAWSGAEGARRGPVGSPRQHIDKPDPDRPSVASGLDQPPVSPGQLPPRRTQSVPRWGYRDAPVRRFRSGYVAGCIAAVFALVASGFSFLAVHGIAGIGSSFAIASGPSTGPQNILLMGLESRRYWNGKILPPQILAKLHAGSARAVAAGVGGNDTNTLILLHISAGGQRAVGFSIPRDDWVQFAGTVGPQQSGKVDQAYGVSMFYAEQQLSAHDPGLGQDRIAAMGNEAGQRAAVATVEKLTGVHIDHFAVVNLYGFYELAKVLDGVEVCLKHPVHDAKSGADFRAGYQHLDASQALAFVRQRDGLPNGDLDRTHRQQAFLDSVLHQLRDEGVLGDLTKIQALVGVAKQYVITDAGWNLVDLAAESRNLTGGHMTFHTLPISGYATIDGQDANVVNPPHIRSIVRSTFYPPPGSQSNADGQGTGSQAANLPAVSTTSPAAADGAQHGSGAVAAPDTGPQGGAVQAKDGIPCVN